MLHAGWAADIWKQTHCCKKGRGWDILGGFILPKKPSSMICSCKLPAAEKKGEKKLKIQLSEWRLVDFWFGIWRNVQGGSSKECTCNDGIFKKRSLSLRSLSLKTIKWQYQPITHSASTWSATPRGFWEFPPLPCSNAFSCRNIRNIQPESHLEQVKAISSHSQFPPARIIFQGVMKSVNGAGNPIQLCRKTLQSLRNHSFLFLLGCSFLPAWPHQGGAENEIKTFGSFKNSPEPHFFSNRCLKILKNLFN